MRLIEVVLFLFTLLIIVLFSLGLFKYFYVIKCSSLIAFTSFVLHSMVEGIRWQLYPIYLIILSFSILTFIEVLGYLNFQYIYSHKLIKRFILVLMIFSLVLSSAAAYTFPIYSMMTPRGPYKIGTISFDAVDLSRKSLYSDGKYENRKIRIQVWYPSDDVSGYRTVPWLEDGRLVAESISKLLGLPKFLFSPTALIKSNSHDGAPISTKQSKYPLVIISHGLTGFSDLHADIAEMLASNGYIAAVINHTYAAAVTVFEDGEVEYFNRDALPLGVDKAEFLSYGNTLLDTYSKDIQFTIDTLTEMNADAASALSNKINLSAIGLVGHSAGGGAGVMTAIKDARIKAIIGFDPWLEPVDVKDIDTGLKIPALFLRSEQWKTDPNNSNLFPLIKSSIGYREVFQINGTTHLDFTMIYMYSPLTKFYGYTGDIGGRLCSSIRQEFILSFFNKYLLNHSNSFDSEELIKKYPDVEKVDFPP